MANSNIIKIELNNKEMSPDNMIKMEPIELKSEVDIKSEMDFESDTEFSNNDKYRDIEVNDTWTTYIWVCSHCHVDYKTIEELRSHAKEEHNMCNAFACFDCNKKFSLFDEFIGHAREHRSALRCHCQYCKEQFTNEELCREHVNSHRTRTQKLCELCGEILPYPSASDIHKQLYGRIVDVDGKVEEKSWQDYQWLCQVCGTRQPDAQSLRTHAQTDHDRCFAFRCCDCPQQMTNYNQFVAHVTTHRPYLMNYCQYCNAFFPNGSQMSQHISQHIAGTQRPCAMCGQVFSDHQLLASHRNTFSGPDTKKRARRKKTVNRNHYDQRTNLRKKPPASIDELTCKYCHKIYDSRRKLTIHTRTHDPTRPRNYVCQICNKAFLNNSILEDHVKIHSAIKAEMCLVCKKMFLTKRRLKAHMLRHSNITAFTCNDCGASFKTKQAVKKHLLTIHSSKAKDKPFRCSYCKEEFKFKEDLITHRLQHTVCHICNKAFTKKSSMEAHLKTHRVNDAEKRAKRKKRNNIFKKPPPSIDELTCKHCLKIYDSRRKLIKHTLTHDERRSRDYVCQICNKAFFKKYTLDDHVQTHSSTKSEICLICKKQFCTKRRLRDHILTHSSIRPFTCDVCGATFKTKRAVKNHLATHSQNKPFKCSFCKKVFKLNKHLVTHRRQHTGGSRTYTCEHCGRKFSSWGNCNKHMLSKHGVTLAKTKMTAQGRINIDKATGEANPLQSDSTTLEWLDNMLKDERKQKNLNETRTVTTQARNLYRAGHSHKSTEQNTTSSGPNILKQT